MLSKYSVKKPFTVLVGVIMILVLGIVSLTNMKSDLLPSMNMPYSVVYTTYYGASPEEVEEQVTRPIESAMAKVSNISKITSVSSENVSMVILKFDDDANMDSITIEVRESIDQIKSTWSSSVGSPIIMNINPDMMPVLITAVNVEGLSGTELTDYVDKNLTNRLESIEGVASVTPTGGVEQSVNVTINQDKLAAANERVKSALDGTFSNAKNQISSAKSQVTSGLNQVNAASESIAAAKAQISEKQAELSSQLSEAKAQADSELINLIETKIELNNKLSELTTQKESLQTQRDAAQTAGDYQKVAALDIAINQVNTAINSISTTLTELENGRIQIEQAKVQLSIQESQANYQLYSSLAETSSKGEALESTKSSLNQSLSSINQQESSLNDTISTTYEKTDLTKLITRSLVGQILTAQNFSMPAGYILNDDNSDVIVRVGDKLTSTTDIEDLVIMDLGIDGLDPIKISDVCDVEYVDNSGSVYAKINGEDGILLTFQKQTGYSTGDVSEKIQEVFSEIEGEEDVTFSIIMDQGLYIDYIVNSVFQNLLWGAIFAIVILLIFLRSIKPTLIVAVSIPVSLLFAIVAMYFSGINLNIISLSGLALSVGMLVDNSIVVIENIYRLRAMGVPLHKACIDGARQVAGAIIASTLTTICVFVPIIFTTGLTRQLFVDLGLTIGYSLIASLIIALTVVPAMSTGLLKKPAKEESKFITKLQDFYAKTIKVALAHKVAFIVGAVALLTISGTVAYLSGTSFMPDMESTQVTVEITAPEGSTFEDATKYSDTIIERIQDIEDIKEIGAMAGSSGMSSLTSSGSSSGNTISMYLVLNENKKLSNSELEKEIISRTEDLDCEIKVSSAMSDMTSIFGDGISVKVSGNDTDKLIEVSEKLAEGIAQIEGTCDIDSGVGDTTPEFRITIDKEAASKHNLTVATVYQQIAAKISTSTTSTTLNTGTKSVDVYVYDSTSDGYTIDTIKDIIITATKSDGSTEEVKLSDIATFTEAKSLDSIRRSDQTRVITVKASLEDGYNVGNIGKEVQAYIDEMEIPSGVTVEVSGLNENINDTLSQLILMLCLAVLFVYLVMVAQFQSLIMPFIIMFTIPLAFTGGFLGLIVSGLDISVISMLGFVILAGIIVNNGIVLVDYINQLRLGGMDKHEAIIEAGRTRLRPILMTALTTILGLIMMALAVGMGADMTQPMAVVTIGGLLYGTLMTLWIVPCIYDIFTGKRELKKHEDEPEEGEE